LFAGKHVLVSGGTGYISPVVTIGDAYGTGSGAEAIATAVGGVITSITVSQSGSGYTAPTVTVSDTSGSGSGAVVEARLDVGTLTGGLRKFVDSLPLVGPVGANTLGQFIPVAVPDTTTYPGSDYYEIALVEYRERMHRDLPPVIIPPGSTLGKMDPLSSGGTKLRGYVQETNGTPVGEPHYLGPLIFAQRGRPVRIKFTNRLAPGAGGNLFLPVDTTVAGAGQGPTGGPFAQNRGTLHLNGGDATWISDGTAHQWITPAGETTPYPNGVSVYNVPDMPNPGAPGSATNPAGSGSQTFYYSNDQSARLLFFQDRSFGITRLNVYAGESAPYLITEPIEQALINGGTVNGRTFSAGTIPADMIPLIIQDRTFVDPLTLGAQDPTWSGPATLGSLWFPHVYMPNQNPGDLSGLNAMGRWHYGPYFWPPIVPAYGPVANPYYDPTCDPAVFGSCEPPTMPGTPNPSIVPDAFMDTPVVNGTAYPFLEVQPRAYRFRVLNLSNDRFWNLQLYQADGTVAPGCPTCATNSEVKMVPFNSSAGISFPPSWGKTDDRPEGVPDPAKVGPPWIQIGSDGGWLPKPAQIFTQPINYVGDKGWATFGNIKEHSLLLGPGERADVIVDFSAFAGQTLILYNDAPGPAPAGDPRVDYYTGKPDQSLADEGTGGSPTTYPGFGPNTRTIMQIRVGGGPASPFDLAALNAAFAPNADGPGAFAQSQEGIIVPQSAYNSTYGASFTDVLNVNLATIPSTSLTFTARGQTMPLTFPFDSKAIIEEMELDYGRQNGLLGVEVPNTNFLNQTTILQGFNDPPTELLRATDPTMVQIGSAEDGTALWRITHNGVNTHAVKFPFPVQVVNRLRWDNGIEYADPNELGWKQIVRVNPLSDTIVAMRPTVRRTPFAVPNNFRPLAPHSPIGSTLPFTGYDPQGNPVTVTNQISNFGWEYAWNTHGLGLAEQDMMRPVVIAVAPSPPSGLLATGGTNSVMLTWAAASSAAVTGFTVQRANEPTFAAPSATWKLGQVTTFTDTNPPFPAWYRIKTDNTVGSTVPGYSTVIASSPWSAAVYVPVATAPVATWAATSLSFGNRLVNSTTTRSVTLTNNGNAPLAVSTSTTSGRTVVVGGTNAGDFSITQGTCSSSLAAGASCALSVRFRPTALGLRTASVSVTGGGPAVLQLSGTGIAPELSVSPPSLSFTSPLNVASSSQFVTVRNTGTAVLVITSIAITGTNANEFARTHNCPEKLPVNGSCGIAVRFRPTAGVPGAIKRATLGVSVDKPATSQKITLTGTVITP